MAAHRDLLYVISRVRSPPTISVDGFHAWYDTVHVPDVLKTSAVDTAYRYNAATESMPWRFLAIYPVHDMPRFAKEEYLSIPATSDALPGPTHSCFDVAEFDIRTYRPVASGSESDILADAACDLLIVEFNLPSDVDETDAQAIKNWFNRTFALQRSQRVGIYKSWAVLYQDEKPDTLPTYMALVEIDGSNEDHSKSIKQMQSAVPTAQWKLRNVFSQ